MMRLRNEAVRQKTRILYWNRYGYRKWKSNTPRRRRCILPLARWRSWLTLCPTSQRTG